MGSLICSRCQTPLDKAITNKLKTKGKTVHLEGQGTGQNEPRFGTARFQPQARLILRQPATSRILEVDIHITGEVILGRSDPETGSAPEVDLDVFDAATFGVSRRHARIDILDDSLRITDLESANATYLNGLRLMPNQPRILRNGDEINLGRLKLQVMFVEGPG